MNVKLVEYIHYILNSNPPIDTLSIGGLELGNFPIQIRVDTLAVLPNSKFKTSCHRQLQPINFLPNPTQSGTHYLVIEASLIDDKALSLEK